MSYVSNLPLQQYPQYFLNKIKIVGTGTNRSVAPCEPFYLLDPEWPMTENQITGATNLIDHYGLKNAYQKFFRGNLKDELSGFLPHLSGNVNMPASADDSGLMGLIEHPPIRGKELTPFPSSQLDPAVRLHPGPLPQEYMSLFMAATTPTTTTPSNRNPPTDGTSSTPSNVRKRRRDVHRASASGIASESAIGLSNTAPSTTSAAAANLPLRNQQQHHHHHHHPPSAAPTASSVIGAAASTSSMAPHSGPLINIASGSGVAKPVTSAGYFATLPPAATIRRNADEFPFMPSSGGGGGASSVESPGGDFDDELRRKKRRKEKKSGGLRKERME